MKYEKSCGAIIFRRQGERYEFLLIQHTRGRHWGFPKGHVEKNETEKQTARREVYEETGLEIKILPGFRKEERYSPTRGVLKTVVYFFAEALSPEVTYILPEVKAHAWLPLPEALSQLAFRSQQRLLKRAYEYLQSMQK
jgi:8-oxo-dGTP pyrophosphatase MutT (NUDIX family)